MSLFTLVIRWQLESMVRERVDVHGRLRTMEPPSDIAVLQVSCEEVGLIKEIPVKRWLAGQQEWGEKFKHSAERVERKRRKTEREAGKLMRNLEERRQQQQEPPPSPTSSAGDPGGENVRRWGPLDVEHENPPPSAIAGRRDTVGFVTNLYSQIANTQILQPDALALLKIYFSSSDSSALRHTDAIRAAFGKRDVPAQPYHQSSSEQQVKQRLLPVHGLSMWSNLMRHDLFISLLLRKLNP